MKLNRKQMETMMELGDGYVDVEQIGPFLAVSFWVNSASSSGDTTIYLNRDGEKVKV